MTILRSGSTKQYSENWAKAFGKKKTKAASKSKATAKKKSPAKKKSSGKK